MDEETETQGGEDQLGGNVEACPQPWSYKAGLLHHPYLHPILALSYLPGLIAKVPVQTHRKLISNMKDSGSRCGGERKSVVWMSMRIPSRSFTNGESEAQRDSINHSRLPSPSTAGMAWDPALLLYAKPALLSWVPREA